MVTKPDNNDEFDTISAAIGELRSDSRRHTEATSNVLLELRRLSERMDALTAFGTELREYRKTLHDRFDRINENMSHNTLDIEKLDTRLTTLDERIVGIDNRINLIETMWKSHWKIAAVVGSVLLTVMGWTIGSYGQAFLKVVFGTTP
jgi:chromosome segregation ATPase